MNNKLYWYINLEILLLGYIYCYSFNSLQKGYNLGLISMLCYKWN
jgi:hypothetical protein